MIVINVIHPMIHNGELVRLGFQTAAGLLGLHSVRSCKYCFCHGPDQLAHYAHYSTLEFAFFDLSAPDSIISLSNSAC